MGGRVNGPYRPRVSILTGRVGAGQAQDGSNWSLHGAGTSAGDLFGFSVAVSRTIIVVSGPSHASNAGRAYVFGA
jgi:hypothetical protein